MHNKAIKKGILGGALLMGLLAPLSLQAEIACPATIPAGCECVTKIASGQTIPQNQLCLVGKLDDPDHVIDFVATQLNPLGEEKFEELLPSLKSDDGSFQIKVLLDQVGDYQIQINAHRYNGATVPLSYSDDSLTIMVKKEGMPDFAPNAFFPNDGSSMGQSIGVTDGDANGVYETGTTVNAKEVDVCVMPNEPGAASPSGAEVTNKVTDIDVPGRVFTITPAVTVSPWDQSDYRDLTDRDWKSDLAADPSSGSQGPAFLPDLLESK